MRAVLLLAFVLAFAAPARAALVVVGATLIDGNGAAPIPDSAVVIEGDRVVAAGPAATVRVPPGATFVDARGKFLVPGFWDLHVHVLRDGRPEAYFPVLVAHGIVGVRDMGGRFDFARIARLKAEVASGARLGPRFVAPGPIVDGPWAQLPSLSVIVADAEAARAEVRRLHAQGADFVKVFNRLTRDAWFAIADESRRLGLPFAGHVPLAISAREASEGGQKSLEHLFNVSFACATREDELMRRKAEALASDESGERRRLRRAYLRDALASFDDAKCASLFQAFARNGTWMCPTLIERRAFALPDPSIATDPDRRYVPKSERALWDPQQDRRIQGREEEDRSIERAFHARDVGLVAPMRRAGVGFLAGTDAGDLFSIPGPSLHRELELLVEAGLTPMEALQAATRNAATFLGTDVAAGTIAAGLRADLVLLDADPLADIRNTRRIAAVAIGGRWLDRATLDRILADAAAAAERS
ncbi:MAG TPA: amidohydrolase family protein [Nevskiaceae bacterium]|nr:amidohydrolase family protein [Nevskiaceae bacterium]